MTDPSNSTSAEVDIFFLISMAVLGYRGSTLVWSGHHLLMKAK